MDTPGKLFWKYVWYAIYTLLAVEVALTAALPVALVAFGAGAAVGFVMGLLDVITVLSGRGPDPDVLSPLGVAAGRLHGRVSAAHVRRDRAWPQYFAEQLRLDVTRVLRSGWRRVQAIRQQWASPLRQHRRRKLFYLWPVAMIVAACFVGIAVGLAATQLLLTIIAVAFQATMWALGLAVVAALRGLDRIWQVVRRAHGSCPRCYAVTSLPAYRCNGGHLPAERLDDDDLHRDIRPGRLGVLWRRCACGRRLPTTVLRASRQMTACCPTCTEPMHPGAAVATDVRVPVFGAASSGKTHLIVATVVSLLEPPAGTPAAATLIDDYSKRRYQDYAELVHHDRPVPKTDAATQPIAVTLQLTEGKRVALLHLFDAAGEALANPAVSAAYSYLDNARTLLFVLDPFSIPDIRDQMATTHADAFREANPAQSDPEASYQATVKRLRISGVQTERQRLAFVLSKRDLLATLPLPNELPTDSELLKAWLIGYGLDNLVLSAERDFGEVKFFAISSKDRSADGPLAPIQWLLATDRFPVRTTPVTGLVAPRRSDEALPSRASTSEVTQT